MMTVKERYDEISKLAKEDKIFIGYVHKNAIGFYGPEDKYYISPDPKNIANFIMKHQDCLKIMITDTMDKEVLTTCGYFLDTVRDMFIRGDVLEYLEPMQEGYTEAEDPLEISIKEAYDYERGIQK